VVVDEAKQSGPTKLSRPLGIGGQAKDPLVERPQPLRVRRRQRGVDPERLRTFYEVVLGLAPYAERARAQLDVFEPSAARGTLERVCEYVVERTS